MMNNIKIGFNFLISFALILTPCYGYAVPSEGRRNSHFESIIDRFTGYYTEEEIPPTVLETVRILEEMGDAIDEGRWAQYVDEHHPQFKNKFRVLSLGNQSVDILDPTDKTEPVTINFDDNGSTHPYEITVRNIEVDFDEEDERFRFKGIIVEGDEGDKGRKKQIGLIHKFEDITMSDVISWDYDGEILAVLHREHGIILYHMMFVKTVLGSSAVPSIAIESSESLADLHNVHIEFIDRTTPPPVDLSENTKITAGDLLVSYKDSDGEKVTAQIFSRATDLNRSLFDMYLNLELLLQIRLSLISNLEDVRDFETGLLQIERDIERVMQIILIPLINEGALASLDKFKDLIKPMKYFLVYRFVDKDRDQFSTAKWIESYEKLREKAPELFDSKRSNVTGRSISSAQIARILKDVIETVEQTDDSKLKKFLKGFETKWEGTQFAEKHPEIVKFVSENLISIPVTLTALIWVFINVSEIPKVDASNYTIDTIYQLVLIGAGFLFSTFALAQYSIRILRVVEKFTPKSRLKVAINQTIERWENRRMRDRLAGFGFRLAGAILPVFYRMFQLAGQPHLFLALTQGLNPFERVTPDSSIGKVAGVNSPKTLLGLEIPRWRTHRENYQVKSRVINTAVEQKQKIESLSRVMAYYAMSGKSFSISSLLTGPLNLRDGELDNIHENKKLMRDFMWVSQQLAEHIRQSESTDVALPVLQWDAEDIDRYYEKALSLTEEVQNVSWTRRQVRSLNQAVGRFLRNALNWNMEHAARLMQYYPEESIADQFYFGLIMDHITLITFPLTPLTPRGDFFLGNMSRIAVEPNTFFNSSGPHIHEGAYNIYWHDVATSRQQLVNLLPPTAKEKLINMSEEFQLLYEPIETYMNSTENKAKFLSYLRGIFPFLFTSSSWGDKINKGTDMEDRIDVGHLFWKTLKLSYRFIVPAVSVGVLSRMFFAESAALESLLGMMYFFLGGFVIFGWPQISAMSYNQVFNRKAAERKQIIDRIKLVSSRINDDLYDSTRDLDNAYKNAIIDFKKLYYSSRSASTSIVLDDIDFGLRAFIMQEDVSAHVLTELVNSQSLEDKQTQMRNLSLLLNTRDLPTTGQPWGVSFLLLFTMGIYSNIAFVFLSVMSFEPTLEWALKFGLGTLAGVFVFNLLTSKTPAEHKEFVKNKVRNIRDQIKNKCSELFTKKNKSD